VGIIATYFITLCVFLLIGMGSWQLRDRGTWRRLRENHDEGTPA
jgi:hypothetical protein